MSGGIGQFVAGGRVPAVVALAVLAGCGGVPADTPTASGASPDAGSATTGEPAAGTGASTAAGPTTATAAPGTTTTTLTMTDHPGLESVLTRLVRADNRTAFAAEHDLDIDDSRVLVVIELEDDADVPDGYDLTVTSRYGTQVQAYVSINDLRPLVGEGTVRVVRRPIASEPQG